MLCNFVEFHFSLFQALIALCFYMGALSDGDPKFPEGGKHHIPVCFLEGAQQVISQRLHSYHFTWGKERLVVGADDRLLAGEN